MPPTRKAAGAAKAAPAARRPAKKAAPPPAMAEAAVEPPAAKRLRPQAGPAGRSRSDAAQPKSWLELAECKQFQTEVAEITDGAALEMFLQRLQASDPRKHRLIQANPEAFAAMLPTLEINNAENDNDEHRMMTAAVMTVAMKAVAVMETATAAAMMEQQQHAGQQQHTGQHSKHACQRTHSSNGRQSTAPGRGLAAEVASFG